MFPALDELSGDDLARIVEDNAVGGCRPWAAWPRLNWYEDDGLTWMISDVPFFIFNGILSARFPAEEVRERVPPALAPFRENGLPLAWWVGPRSAAELHTSLESEGLARMAVIPGMAADLRHLPEAPVPKELTVEEVTDEEGLWAWCDVGVRVFEFPPEVREPWHALHAAMGLGLGRPWRHYLGLWEGKPVATASLFTGPEAASPASVGTAPELRRRGIGTAMTAATLRDARKQGYRVATLCSSALGEGMYRGLGFRTCCRLSLYVSA